MDSQERHELQENDLAEFIANFGEWWQKYGNAVLIGVMVLLLAGAAWRFFSFQAASSHEAAWADLAFATSPDAFRAVAQSHDDPAVKTLAYLHGGDLLLGRALSGDQPIELTPSEGEAAADTPAAPVLSREELLTGARGLYEEALESAPHDLYRVNALMGLAAVGESQERWDDARRHYEQVIEVAEQKFPHIVRETRTRMNMLDELSEPIVFAPEAPSPPTETPTPETTAPEVSESSESPQGAAVPQAPAVEPAPTPTPGSAPAPESDGQ